MIDQYIKALIGEEIVLEDGTVKKKTGFISMLIGGCDSYQALLLYGELVLIVNSGIIYTINVSDMFPPDLQITIYYRNTTKGSVYEIEYNPELANQIMQRIYPLSLTGNEAVVYYCENFDQNELFQEMRNGKITDGQFKFILDSNYDFKIIFMLYKGIFNMAKADRLSLVIYEKSFMYGAPNGTYLEFVFNLYKKKINKQYEIKFLILNLWRDRRFY